MSDAEQDQGPLPKKQKLCSAIASAEGPAGEGLEAAAARAGDSGESPAPAIMLAWGGKFLREADAGITEYISSQPGFFAILKQRLLEQQNPV